MPHVDHYSYKILSLEASFIYNCMNRAGVADVAQGIPDAYLSDGKGGMNFSRFHGQLDMNLETVHMENCGLFRSQAVRQDDGTVIRPNRYKCDDMHYTDAFITVAFKTSLKKFNTMYTANGIAYVKDGYLVLTGERKNENSDFAVLTRDHILIKDGKIVAVEVLYSVNKANEADKKKRKKNKGAGAADAAGNAGGYRIINDSYKKYKIEDSGLTDKAAELWEKYSKASEFGEAFEIVRNSTGKKRFFAPKDDFGKINKKAVKDAKALRTYLYKNGFNCAGRHYVRYKRSAGSGREGNCLFIEESLLQPMTEWSSCGFDADVCRRKDATGWEAYSALTLSSLMQLPDKKKPVTLDITRGSILVIPDAKAKLVASDGGKLLAIEKSADRDNAPAESKKDTGAKKSVGLLTATEKVLENEYNTIWDGQALIDSSLFEKAGLGDKGMMLLRNRFFKTCGFNTNLQEWFSDNGITSVSAIADYAWPRPKRIKDIKMVVTPSSIKYLKFCEKSTCDGSNRDNAAGKLLNREGINAWLDSIEGEPFGVVKTDKPTGHLEGRMVSTNYQLLNTLDIDGEGAAEILRDSLDYLGNINENPAYLAHYLKLKANAGAEDEADYTNVENTETETSGAETDREESENVQAEEDAGVEDWELASEESMYRLTLLQSNPEICKTKVYNRFMTYLNRGFRRKLKSGRILVNGNYATLMGNGAEMLAALLESGKGSEYRIDSLNREAGGAPEEPVLLFDKPLALQGNEICITRFADGAELVCERSPHITMGNLLRASNKLHGAYKKYFNLTNEIVCINSINNDIMERLNGCDFDSDSMLVTDNCKILRSARPLAVPVNTLHHKANGPGENTDIVEYLAQMDDTIACNNVGKIINLSQLMNSIYWTVGKLPKPEDTENIAEKEYLEGLYNTYGDTETYRKRLYEDICILSVLSGMEIDKAKRDYGIDSRDIISPMKKRHVDGYVKAYGKPRFFTDITGDNCTSGVNDVCGSAMAHIYRCVSDNAKQNRGTRRNDATETVSHLAGITKEYPGDEKLGKIKDICEKATEKIRAAGYRLRSAGKADEDLVSEIREEKKAIKEQFRKDIFDKIKKDTSLSEDIILGMEDGRCLKNYTNILLEALTSELAPRLERNRNTTLRQITIAEGSGEAEAEGASPAEYCTIYGYRHIIS